MHCSISLQWQATLVCYWSVHVLMVLFKDVIIIYKIANMMYTIIILYITYLASHFYTVNCVVMADQPLQKTSL